MGKQQKKNHEEEVHSVQKDLEERVQELQTKNNRLETKVSQLSAKQAHTQHYADNLQIILDGLQSAFQTGELSHYLEIITSYASKLVNADRATLWLYEENANKLYTMYAEGLDNKRLQVPLENTLSGYSFTTNTILNIKDAWNITDEVPFKYNTKYDRENDYRVKSVACIPISIYDTELEHEKKRGVLQVINKGKDDEKEITGTPFTTSDIKLLETLSVPICSLLDIIEKKTELQKSHRSTIETLVKTIDAKHRGTAGHSENVQAYAMAIAEELDMDARQKDTIFTSAILHDIGKIGIHDSVLEKQGLLTMQEYDEIKQHARSTYDILSQIHFPPHLRNVPDIASAHHEEDDGNGYPFGLKRDEIPHEAKILRVADVYDAVTSDRDYREPMPLLEAIGGVLVSTKIAFNAFDKETVHAFIESDASQVAGPYKDKMYSLDDIAAVSKRYTCQNKNIMDSFFTFLKDQRPHSYREIKSFDAQKHINSTTHKRDALLHSEIKNYLLWMIDSDNFWKKRSPYRIFDLGDTQTDEAPYEFRAAKPLHGLNRIIYALLRRKEQPSERYAQDIPTSQIDTRLQQFSLKDIYSIVASQKYSDRPVTLCQFVSKMIPLFVQSGTVPYDEAYDFLSNERWSEVSEYAPRQSIRFTKSDFLSTNKEISRLIKKDDPQTQEFTPYLVDIRNECPDNIKELKQTNKEQMHKWIKTFYMDCFTEHLSPSQYLRKVDQPESEGFTLHTLTNIFSNKYLVNSEFTPESIAISVYRDYMKKGKIGKDQLKDYLATTEYLLPFYLAGTIKEPNYDQKRFQRFSHSLEKAKKKGVRYDYNLLKTMNNIEHTKSATPSDTNVVLNYINQFLE